MDEGTRMREKIEKRFTVSGDKSPYHIDCTRDDLAVLFGELGYTTGAEIGVHLGHYSLVLFQHIPNLKLYCVDPWGFYYPEKVKTERRVKKRFRDVRKNLAKCNVGYMVMTSEEAAKIVPDNSLDFVYIDAEHDYDNVLLDITLWSKKVREGGIVSGHDYMLKYRNHKHYIVEAVTEYVRLNEIPVYYVTNVGPDWRTIHSPSWFWVK